MTQMSPETKEIGIQVNFAMPNLHQFEEEEMSTYSDSDLDESDIEWTFRDQDRDGETGSSETTDMSGDAKFIIYKSSLQQLLQTHCLHCGTHILPIDYTWYVLGTMNFNFLCANVNNKYLEPNSQQSIIDILI